MINCGTRYRWGKTGGRGACHSPCVRPPRLGAALQRSVGASLNSRSWQPECRGPDGRNGESVASSICLVWAGTACMCGAGTLAPNHQANPLPRLYVARGKGVFSLGDFRLIRRREGTFWESGLRSLRSSPPGASQVDELPGQCAPPKRDADKLCRPQGHLGCMSHAAPQYPCPGCPPPLLHLAY